MLIPMVLVILLIVVGLGFMMYKRFKNRLKKQRAKLTDLTQMLQSRSQQKEEEEEEEEEKKEETVPSNDDFSNIDTTEGHPIVKAPTKTHYPYGGTWWAVRKGRAKNPERCWKNAKRNNITGWGWRKYDKSCWHYLDPLLMTADTHPGSEQNHLMGCTKPGQKIEDGCIDFDHGHTVWGHDNRKKPKLKPHQIWSGVGGHQHDKMSPGQCRQKAKEAGFKVAGYRTAFHPADKWKNTCFTMSKKNSSKGYIGNAVDLAHIMMCTDPTKRVVDGC